MNDRGHAVHTTWNTPEIWIRRTVEIPSSLKPFRLRFEACHDEDLEVSLDGVPAARWAGYSDYVFDRCPRRRAPAHQARWGPPRHGRALPEYSARSPGFGRGRCGAHGSGALTSRKVSRDYDAGWHWQKKLPLSDPRRRHISAGTPADCAPRNRGDAPKVGEYHRGRASPA